MTFPFHRGRFDGLAGGLYRYHQGDIFLPGTGNLVFEPAFGLPLSDLQGQGSLCGNPPRSTQPQIVFATHTTTLAGLGGVVAGQMIFQPLNDPSQGD